MFGICYLWQSIGNEPEIDVSDGFSWETTQKGTFTFEDIILRHFIHNHNFNLKNIVWSLSSLFWKYIDMSFILMGNFGSNFILTNFVAWTLPS